LPISCSSPERKAVSSRALACCSDRSDRSWLPEATSVAAEPISPAAGRLEAALLLQVHDELVLECPAGCSTEVAARVKELMEGAMDLSVPLSVETGIGENWGTAH